ncbi:hypothetical protein [Nocardioides sp. B-3]|uniref:hypothetical protein n=1 Tax=Nocardioides sp. B-3 TaxID=2895565 RepID=UPI003FA5E931
MTQLDDDLARIVREDPPHTGAVDTAGLIRSGTRLRRRRQLAVTAGAGLAAAAVVAPFLLLGGGEDTVGISPADSPRLGTTTPSSPSTDTVTIDELQDKAPRTPLVCGVMACADRHGRYGRTGSPEEGTVTGSPLDMGVFHGNMEVLYATDGILSSGIVDDGRLIRTVWAFRPEEEGLGPMRVYGGERTVTAEGRAHFGIIGYVKGVHTEVTAGVNGETRGRQWHQHGRPPRLHRLLRHRSVGRGMGGQG